MWSKTYGLTKNKLHKKLRIWSYLLNKSVVKTFIFCAVHNRQINVWHIWLRLLCLFLFFIYCVNYSCQLFCSDVLVALFYNVYSNKTKATPICNRFLPQVALKRCSQQITNLLLFASTCQKVLENTSSSLGLHYKNKYAYTRI